jgi:phosphate:Na+ symporter
MLILQMAGGLVLFLGGLKMMSGGMSALCGTSFERVVRHYTGSRLSAFLVGVLFTAVTQSSSLASVIIIGAVDAGIMGLSAAIAVIIGANVGTTFTGQMLSLSLGDFSLYFVVVGIIGVIVINGILQQAARAVLGLGLLLYGLQNMGYALTPLIDMPWASSLLQMAGKRPAAGILAGAVLTAVVQSSSAVAGTVIALAKEGAITLSAGAGLMVGADVGTCVTSLIAGLESGRNARRAALAHLLFNVISVMLVLPLFSLFVLMAQASADNTARQLANAHTMYNLTGAVVLLCLLRPFQYLLEWIS